MATFICASENRLPVELAATEKQSRVIVVSSLFMVYLVHLSGRDSTTVLNSIAKIGALTA